MSIDVDQGNLAVCIAQAAQRYGADGVRVAALVVARGGRTGEIRQLPNGDIEIGLSRIPGREAEALRPNGITPQLLADDDCLNVTIAAYVMQRDAIAVRASGASARVAATISGSREEGCMVTAAQRYAIPLAVFRAVVDTEGGRDGLKKRNQNGSFDLGRAQINTIHLPELAKYGVSETQLIRDACVNLHVAAYRLRFEINRAGDFWRGVGNYHSRTPALNAAYQARVRSRLGDVR
jgi:hypothetical protein